MVSTGLLAARLCRRAGLGGSYSIDLEELVMMRSSGDERHKERLETAAMLSMKALKLRSRPCWLVRWMRKGHHQVLSI